MAKIGKLMRKNSQGTLDQLVYESTTDAIPDFDTAVAAKLANNVLFKTAAVWASDNTILLAGQIGQETDTSFVKIGNGVTAWNNLSYAKSTPLVGHIVRKTAAVWASDNTVLVDGQIGMETDTNLFKFGDGNTTWNDLPYMMTPTTTVELATVSDGTTTITTDDTITLTFS